MIYFRYFLAATVLFLFALPEASADGKRILFVGDSHSLGEFGRVVDNQLRSAGHDIYTIVDGDAGPYHWLKAYRPFSSRLGYWEKSSTREVKIDSGRIVPKIEDLIASYKPDWVVIQAGKSLYSTLRSPRRSQSDNEKEIRTLVSLACKAAADSGAKTYWILPPHSHENLHPRDLQEKLSYLITNSIDQQNGYYFESRRVTLYTKKFPESDGVTLEPKESADWARRVCSDLLRKVHL